MSPKRFVLALLLLISVKSTQATIYRIINHSDEVLGGNKHANELDSRYKSRVLFGTTREVLNTFNQKEGKGKEYNEVTLLIESFRNLLVVASTKGNLIRLNVDYLHYRGDIQEEFAGVVYHEMTHVWQWTGIGMSPTGLINGIADNVRLKGGYASKSWPRRGSRSRWDDGFALTAYFLEYCNDLKNGFVAEVNALMKDSYSAAFFVQLVGKSVHELWRHYQLARGTRRIPSDEEGYLRAFPRTSPKYNYILLKPEYVLENKANLNSLEHKHDSLRAAFTGVALEANHFQRNDIAGSSKDLVKNLGNCNGVWSCLLA